MAQVKTEARSIEVPDGGPIQDACDEMGVPFGCRDGLCGACEIEVVEGMENLTERTENETDLGIEGNNRLACQCRIKQGDMKFRV